MGCMLGRDIAKRSKILGLKRNAGIQERKKAHLLHAAP